MSTMRYMPPSVLLALLITINARAVDLYTTFPEEIRANEVYVIFSHGLIAEGRNPLPTHAAFGLYDLPGIRSALFDGGGFNLFAPQRAAGEHFSTHVNDLANWVHRLVGAGVPSEHIVLVGFSRGAQITAVASARLSVLGVNTALLGACIDGDIRRDPVLVLKGRLFSIYESTDQAGSCHALAARSQLLSFDELQISTGEKHGAFFRPDLVWIGPLREWIARVTGVQKLNGGLSCAKSALAERPADHVSLGHRIGPPTPKRLLRLPATRVFQKRWALHGQ